MPQTPSNQEDAATPSSQPAPEASAGTQLQEAPQGTTHEPTLDEMILMVCRAPAARTAKWVRLTQRKRITPLLLDALWTHADAHDRMAAATSLQSAAAEQRASAWAWAMPTLLLRVPPTGEATTRRQLGNAIERRLIQAELGQWHAWVRDYLEEQLPALLHSWQRPPVEEPLTDGMRFQKASAKMDAGAIGQARNQLEAGGRAPPTKETHEEIRRLIAVETPLAERLATAAACAEARKKLGRQQGPSTDIIKRLCRELCSGAEPGPSAWRNEDVRAVCRSDHGPQALRRWLAIWQAGAASSYTAALWGAALVTPLDCGPRKPTAEEAAGPPRPPPCKLRPIALNQARDECA